MTSSHGGFVRGSIREILSKSSSAAESPHTFVAGGLSSRNYGNTASPTSSSEDGSSPDGESGSVGYGKTRSGSRQLDHRERRADKGNHGRSNDDSDYDGSLSEGSGDQHDSDYDDSGHQHGRSREEGSESESDGDDVNRSHNEDDDSRSIESDVDLARSSPSNNRSCVDDRSHQEGEQSYHSDHSGGSEDDSRSRDEEQQNEELAADNYSSEEDHLSDIEAAHEGEDEDEEDYSPIDERGRHNGELNREEAARFFGVSDPEDDDGGLENDDELVYDHEGGEEGAEEDAIQREGEGAEIEASTQQIGSQADAAKWRWIQESGMYRDGVVDEEEDSVQECRRASQEQLFAHMNQDSARGGDRSVRGVDLLVEKWRERSSDSAGIAVASSSSGKAALSSVSRRASPSTSKAAVVSPGPAGVVGITPEKDGSSYSRRSSSDQRRGSRGYVQMREQRLQQRMRNSPFQLKGQTNSPTQVKGSHGVPQQSNTSAICTRQEEAEAPRRSASKEEPRTSSSSSTHPNQQKQHSSSRVSSATTTADANSSHCLLNSDLLSTINSVNSTLISTNSEIVPETTREVVVDSEAGSRDQPADAVERADVPTPFTPVDLERRKHPSRCSTAASSSSCETSGEKQLHYSHYLADDHKQDAPSYSLFRSANAVLAAQEAEATRGSQKQGAVSSSRNSSRMNFYSAAEEHEGYGSCSSSGVKTKSSYQLSTSVGHDHHPRSGVRMERQCSTLASHHASTACSPRRALQTSFSRETHTPPLSPAVVLGKACCRAPGISIQKSVLGGRSRTPTSSAQPSPSNHSSTSLTPSHSPCPSFSSPSSGGVVESGAASGGFSREKRGSNYRVEERDERQQSTPSYGGSLSSSGTATKQTTAKQVLERRFDPRRGCYSYGNGKHPGGYSTRAGSTSGAGLASLPSAFQPSARRAGPGPSVVISGDSPASSSRSSRTAVERRTKMWDQNFSPVSSTSSCMMNYQGAARGSATRQATTASVASSSSSKGHYEKPKSRVARIKLCVCANSATLARERCRLLKEEAAFFQDVQSWQAREKGLNERHARLESRKAQIAKRKAEEGSRKSAVAEAKKEVEQLKSETLPSLRQKSEAAAKQIADVRTALNEREGKVGEDRSKRLAEEDTFVAETSKERARWADKEKELRRKIAKMERKLGIEILSGTSSTSSSRIEATSLLEHKKDEDQDEDAIMLPQELALSLEETKIATDSVLDPLRKDVAALQNNVLSKRQTVERRRAELLPRKEKFEERRKRRRAFQDQIASVKREYALAVEKAEKTDAECAQLALSIRQFGEKIESSMSFAAEQCEIGDRLEEEVEDLHAKNAALEADLVARTRLKEAKQRQIREDARQRQEEALLRAGIDAKRSEEERREDAELELSMLQVHIETLKQSHKALNAAIEETTKAVEESREKAQANRDRRAAIRQRMKTQSLSLTGTTGGGTNG